MASPEELAAYELQVEASNRGNRIARSLLPADLRRALQFYESFNRIVVDVNKSYRDVERLAVLTGAVAPGPGSRNIKAGNWAQICDGAYMRTFPITYSTTTVELFIQQGSTCLAQIDDYLGTPVSTPGNTSLQRLLTDWSFLIDVDWVEAIEQL